MALRFFSGRGLRRVVAIALLGTLLPLAGGVAANLYLKARARAKITSSVADAPTRDVAIVLGTAPKIAGRWSNSFFEYRMDAAAELFHAGKVKHLLLTGDNGRPEYDEPTAMREALVKRGVPAEATTLDFAGFRTLDSMARARAIFGLEEAIVVTDEFHLPRALYLAEHFGVKARGYACEQTPIEWAKKTLAREALARVQVLLDVHLLGTQPKFYGPQEPIRLAVQSTGGL